MIPDEQTVIKLLRKYAPNEVEYQRISVHGNIVAEIALDCAKKINTPVDLEILKAACLLHDIGSYVFLAAKEYGSEYENSYPQHAIFGAKILQDEGIDERICSAVETHVLLGLTAEDIKKSGKKLPYKNYEPKTIEARLVCWADRFHSKRPIFNTFDDFYNGLKSNLPSQAKKLKEWSIEFSVPDVEKLSKKYNHPIK